ncbi:MAG: anaerobic ribonucleoside-triphosphate reductase activating protein [Candidatus Bathyarchaeia archaeon]
MKFAGFQRTSLIDYPDRVASVLFTPGCNLRCPYCHNWKIAFHPSPPFLSEEEVLEMLRQRKKYVDAVVVTGGEPTINSDLPSFLRRVKAEGFAVKLDTNGFRPDVLEECMPHLDYVALDVKTSTGKYRLLGADDISPLLKSIELLKKGKVDYEFRTTVVPAVVTSKDIEEIGELCMGAKRIVLQQFVTENAYEERFRRLKPYSAEALRAFADILKPYAVEVLVRA